MPYPHTRRTDTVDILHGTPVPDPYRWLEDADSPEVQQWVAAQRDFTEAQLQQLPARQWFASAMARIVARPRVGVPLKRGGRWFVSRNDGTTAQDVWFTAPTLEELVAGGEVMLDPNTWSDDGTSSLSTFTVARDGSRLAYARSDGGSDWQHIRTRDLTTGEDLDGEVTAKFSTPVWLPDHRSFLYTTFDEASDARGTATAGLGVARLMVHRPDADDELLLTFPDEPHTMAFGEVSHDDAWLVVSIFRGTERVNRLWAYPVTTVDGRSTLGDPVELCDADASYTFIRTDGAHIYLHSDLDAPLGRVIRLPLVPEPAARGWSKGPSTEPFPEPAARGWSKGPAALPISPTQIVAETTATLTHVEPAGDGLLLAYLDDAQHRVEYRNLDGSDPRPVDLPTGAVVTMDSSPLRDEAFVGISTIDTPTVSFHLTLPEPALATRRAEPVEVKERAYSPVPERAPATKEPGTTKGALSVTAIPGPTTKGPAASYTITRHRAPSADGTPVPYFLITPDGDHQGPRPTLLYGYGGFNVPVLADYRPGWFGWLQAGGTLVIANLRGGGEFGTTWYDDGRLANKQNVFDDFIGVAEHLIATGVTTPQQLAIYGRSNGGLLVGAALTQRPDLFAAALPTVGVLDVLRFHKFTIGAAWISDYGDPDTPDGFAAAHAYSPLHRIKEGVEYPPTMILTADHDDRVVPLHSFKFAAALQAVSPTEAWLRIESSAGHGAGKSLDMIASEWADLLTFAAHHTGLEVP